MMFTDKAKTLLYLRNDLYWTGIDPSCIACCRGVRAISCTQEAVIRNSIQFIARCGLVTCLSVAPASAFPSELRPEATQGFNQYVQLTERRMQGELAPGGAFLWVDSLAEPRRREVYARLQRGEVISERVQTS